MTPDIILYESQPKFASSMFAKLSEYSDNIYTNHNYANIYNEKNVKMVST